MKIIGYILVSIVLTHVVSNYINQFNIKQHGNGILSNFLVISNSLTTSNITILY